jgi:hypothetical protein
MSQDMIREFQAASKAIDDCATSLTQMGDAFLRVGIHVGRELISDAENIRFQASVMTMAFMRHIEAHDKKPPTEESNLP